MVREWDQSLRDARVRGVKPKDRARQLAEDINVAQFVLASSDSRLMSWVTTRQVIAAADVLIAHEALGDQQCLYLLRRLVKSSGDDEAELRRVIADGGPAMVRRIAMEREWLGDTLAIRLLTSIAGADNKSLAELPAIAAERDQPDALRISSVELMHGVVTAAGATLPDTIATSLRDLSGHPDSSIAGAAAATLNRLSNRDLSRAVSDKGFVRADVVERSPPPIFDVGSAVAATVPAMKRSAAMNVELANSLIEAYEKDRALIPLGAVVVAADALLAQDALNPRLMSGLIRRAYESTDVDAMELRRLLAKQGEKIVPVLVEFGADIGTDPAAAMMRDAARIEPRAMGRLMAVNQSASWGTYELEAAIRLLDRVTKGKDALPLPDEALGAWFAVVQAGSSSPAAAAIDALIARPQSGFVDADRAGLTMLNCVSSGYAADVIDATKFLPNMKPGRAQSLVEATLIRNLAADQARVRETSADLLSRWPVLTDDIMSAIASFLAGSPILDMRNQDPGSDQRVFHACAKRLAAEGPRVAAVVPRLVPGLNDPVRQRWIVDVLRSVNPSTVRASLVERYRQLVRDRVDESGQLAYVGTVVELAKTDTAAERALLDILYSNPKSIPVRRQLVAALASSVNETANVRAALWWEARSSAAEIRQAAVESLAVVGPGEDADLGFAAEWIKTGTAEQRIAAARLIAAAGPRVAETSIPPLLRMSDNVCSLQRGAAATALAKINPAGDRLTPAVLASVYHRDPTMRSYLIAAAKKAGDPKLIERLKDIGENEPDPAVRSAARETIAALAK